MKTVKIAQILLVIIALVLMVYLVSLLIKPNTSTRNLVPTQNITTPQSLIKFQDCLDRANNSEAEQSIIEDSKRECERLYKP